MNEDSYTLTIIDKEILGLLNAYSPDKREANALKALKIGLVALKNIENIENVDYVEKEFQKFKGDIDKEFVLLKDGFVKALNEADTLIKDKLKTSFDPENGVMQQVMKRYLGEGGTLAELFNENNNTSAVGKIKTTLLIS